MAIKNKYIKRSKITEAKFRQLVKLFAHDLDAQTIASLTNLNRNTVNRYLRLIRNRIAEVCETQSPFKGEIEVDESYFGGKRIKGNAAAVLLRKPLCLVFSNVAAKSTLKSFQIALKPLCKALSGDASTPIALSIQIAGAVTTDWLTWVTKSITASAMVPTNLPRGTVTSMVLNPSGHMPNTV